jgi:peptide/nickel transport system permease protein
MWKYLFKRFFLFLFLLICVATLVFLLLHVVPGDPAISVLGADASQEDIQRIRQHLNLDRPFFQQYIHFLEEQIHLRFGESLIDGSPVGESIFRVLPNTVYLAFFAMGLALLISFPLGVWAAFKEHSVYDASVTLISSLGVAVPNFFLGPLLIIFFSIKLGWLPVSGTGGFRHVILPGLTLATSMSALLTRIIKTSVAAELKKPYILLARAKGISGLQLFKNHLFKNALIPIITTVGLQFGALLSGTVITETVFSWQGIGYLLVNAIRQRNYPMVQGIIILVTCFYLLLSFLVDISYFTIDPRIRHNMRHGLKND